MFKGWTKAKILELAHQRKCQIFICDDKHINIHLSGFHYTDFYFDDNGICYLHTKVDKEDFKNVI